MTKFFVSSDKAFIDSVNTGAFAGKPGITAKFVRVAKHPTEDLWAAEIPEQHVASITDRLSTEVADIIVPALVDSLDSAWYCIEMGELDGETVFELDFVD